MSEDNDREVLLEALEAGGYAPAAISAARVAANRGLGKRTTHDLVAAADPAAGKIAAAIFGSREPEQQQPAQPGEAMGPSQAADAETAAAEQWFNDLMAGR